MNCPSPLGNVIVAMMKMTTAGYTKRLWTEMIQGVTLSLKMHLLNNSHSTGKFNILHDR